MAQTVYRAIWDGWDFQIEEGECVPYKYKNFVITGELDRPRLVPVSSGPNAPEWFTTKESAVWSLADEILKSTRSTYRDAARRLGLRVDMLEKDDG